MRLAKKHGIFALAFLTMLLPLLVACGGGDDGNDPVDETPTESDEKTTSDLQEDVKIVIGNITDITGVSANALSVIDMALEDMVEYFNEENLIPGVELKVETYDGQWDPSRYIPGYEWLRNRGADLIWTPAPPALETLKPRANEDEFVIFGATANWKQ
ncbi:MAG: ABC transporter substrate-binding protein, partial [candidate division Zixibacteria bacterium]|nr:ABC transporter substrate-binding protein [candidate division Zixibacteria bacterium]